MPRAATLRILIVDDDARLRKLLTRFLSAHGFSVDAVADSAGMDRQLRRGRCDLVLLDVMMPGENGFTACQRLRAEGKTVSVIMLTAKGDEVDRIVGLRSGADDYVSKPFNPEELLARIEAVLRRRSSPSGGGSLETGHAPTKFGEFSLNFGNRTLAKGDHVITLTPAEFALLKVLVEHIGQPVSRELLMQAPGTRERSEAGRSIDVQVSRLRKLLGDDPHRPRMIKTVWGFGYALMPAASRNP